MRWIRLILLLGPTGVLAACSPAVVLRPLYDSKYTAPADPRIEGKWVTPDLDESGTQDEVQVQWTVESYSTTDGHSYFVDARFFRNEEKTAEAEPSYSVKLLPIEGKLFFDAEYSSEKFGASSVDTDGMGPGVVPGHLVGRLWIQQDFLRVALLDSGWVAEKMPEDFRVMADLSSTGVSGTRIAAITAPAEDVRKFMVTHADDPAAFGIQMYLCRPAVPCAPRAFEDLLSRNPQEEDTIRAAAAFYLRQGNYVRGVDLLRRGVEVQPKDAQWRAALGTGLLFSRDFEAARHEFAAAQQLDPDHTLSWKEIFLSHFLEGNYVQAVNTFADFRASGKSFPAGILLLDYFSLLRLGRAAEARSVQEQVTSVYHGGTWRDDFFVPYDMAFWGTAGLGSRAYSNFSEPLFQAMHWAAKGDRAKAAAALRDLVKAGHKDDLLYLTAKIELERLDQEAAP